MDTSRKRIKKQLVVGDTYLGMVFSPGENWPHISELEYGIKSSTLMDTYAYYASISNGKIVAKESGRYFIKPMQIDFEQGIYEAEIRVTFASSNVQLLLYKEQLEVTRSVMNLNPLAPDVDRNIEQDAVYVNHYQGLTVTLRIQEGIWQFEITEVGLPGKDFRFEDFTPEQIAILQQPASDATEAANTAAENANKATEYATAKIDEVETRTKSAITATNEVIFQANAKIEDVEHRTQVAVENANNARGWSPQFVFENDGTQRQVKKLADWVNGTGIKPTANIGQYVTDNGYTTNKSLATNFKGEQSDNLIIEYVHSGNKEVVVINYDETTGVFTAPNHGLVNGDIIAFAQNVNSTIWLSDSSFTSGLGRLKYVVNVTQDTFQISAAKNGSPEILIKSNKFDLTKWHIETSSSNAFYFNNLPMIKNMRVIISGTSLYQIYYYTDINKNGLGIIQGNGTLSSVVFAVNQYTTSIVGSPRFILDSIFTIDGNGCTELTIGNLVSNSGSVERGNRIKYFNNIREISSFSFSGTFLANGASIKLFKL